MKITAVSGGFDPVHVGHVRMFIDAARLGDKLIIILNNDNWLMKKKGYVFMPEAERVEILQAFRVVDLVFPTQHTADTSDMSVCDMLEKIHPDIFANGGDRKEDNIPEYELCDRMGIEMFFNIGGHKVQSSSVLAQNVPKHRGQT